MGALIIALLALFLFALALGWLQRWDAARRRAHGEDVPEPEIKEARPAGCCGQHAVCEKEELLAAALSDAEYFDDEELDAFRNRPSDAYSPQEVEQFQDVLYTMRADEVASWVRALQLRGVNLPDDLKDEVILLMEGA